MMNLQRSKAVSAASEAAASVARSLEFAKSFGFTPPTLTAAGRTNLTNAGHPTDLVDWLTLVETEHGCRANPRRFAVHWAEGRAPGEAVELVAADEKAQEIVRDVLRLCQDAYVKVRTGDFRYLGLYIAERVVYELKTTDAASHTSPQCAASQPIDITGDIRTHVASAVALARSEGFLLPELTSMGRGNLEEAGLPVDFVDWLALVATNHTASSLVPAAFAYHWSNGRSPAEAIELVSADAAAREIAIRARLLCRGALISVETGAYAALDQYIVDRVVYRLEQSI